MAETITIMGLPFKRRNRSSKPTDHESGSSAAQVDRKPPFFRRRPSLPLSKSGALYPNQTMSAIVSPEHAMRRYHSAASIDSEDSYVQDDDLTVLDEEEELFLPSPNKPAFVGRSIVIRDEPITLERAVRVWVSRTDDLINSKEMSNFLSSSSDLAFVVGGVAIRTACLPVTVPLHVASTATGLVVGTCNHVLSTTGAVIRQVAMGPPPGGQHTSSFGLFHHVFQVIPFTLQTAARIKDGLGATVLHLVAPVLGHNKEYDKDEPTKSSHVRYATSSGESSAEHDSFLDRLRLDYSPSDYLQPPEQLLVAFEEEKIATLPTKSEVSKHLLYTADLDLSNDDAPVASVIFFIDLDKEFADDILIEQALYELVSRGLSLISNVEEVRLRNDYNALPLGCVQWKPEHSTERLIKGLDDGDWTVKLAANTLIWSGRMQGRWSRGHDFPFFLARGIVKGSPREFLNLLWDNSRTNEYNKHSLGRSDLFVIKDGVLDGSSTGTKVVKSETRVPFTGLSVVLATLMHVQPLRSPDEGFVIVSRSLNSGRAGSHVGSGEFVEKGNNEILWGVNILRRVPGKPKATDLTSVSHVATTLVPKFLAHRIGIMGVEDFFSAVRR